MRYGWSDDRSEWNQVASEIYKSKWTTVKFIYDSHVIVPSYRGIYMVVLDVDNIGWQKPFSTFSAPMYIGHSLNLKTRFKTHTQGNKPDNIERKMSEFRNCLKFHFAKFDSYSKGELISMEQSLIDVFGPTVNSINALAKGVKREDSLKGGFQEEGVKI